MSQHRIPIVSNHKASLSGSVFQCCSLSILVSNTAMVENMIEADKVVHIF